MSIASFTALPKPMWEVAWAYLRAGIPELWQRSSRLAWMVLAGCAGLLAILSIAMGFHYAPFLLSAQLVILLALAAGLTGARWLRPALIMETAAILTATFLIVPPLCSALAAMAMPLQDAALAEIDRRMGIDWIAMAFWFRDNPELSRVLCHVYASNLWQPVALLLALTAADPERLRLMITASAITLAITMFGFFLIPAMGPYWYFHFTPADFPDAINVMPWEQPKLIEGLRTGSREMVFSGIVEFPSYHAASALLFAIAWRGVPVIGVFGILLNIVMFVSTVPVGGHYIIDLCAGAAVALLSLSLAKRYYRATDRIPPLEPWTRTREGRRFLAALRKRPIVSALIKRTLKTSSKEAATA
ncbi:MAG: phosphatase PAP2 family protein [Hyphomicrobium sp.]|uniref:phosphatase PAP2 family protein n=1 Tax=Hyphomicrobium sp. TaxID=82 RepID=UPI0035636DA4